jgi:hypothetical protein
LRQAQVRDARVHDTRHTAATLLIEQGVHIRVVREILGHTRVTTTERYIHKGSGIASAERGLRSLPGQDGGKWPSAQQQRQRFDQELRSDEPA